MLMFCLVFGMLVLCNVVFAVWHFGLTSYAIYNVFSDDPASTGDLAIIQAWTGATLITDDTADLFQDKFQIQNLGDPINATFEVDEIKTDIVDGCENTKQIAKFSIR